MTAFAPKDLAAMSALHAKAHPTLLDRPPTAFLVSEYSLGKIPPRISNSKKIPKSTHSVLSPPVPHAKRPFSPPPFPAPTAPPEKKKKIPTPRLVVPLSSKPFLSADRLMSQLSFNSRHDVTNFSAFSLNGREPQDFQPPPQPKFERVQVGEFDIAAISMPTGRRTGLAGKTIVERHRSPQGAGGGFELPFDKEPYAKANICPPGVEIEEYTRRLAVEERLIAADPRLKDFTFSHISRQAGPRKATLYVDGCGRAFAVRSPMSEEKKRAGMEVKLDQEISRSTSVQSIRLKNTYIRPATKDYGRGAYDCRFASLNNEQGNPPGYCPAFKTQPDAWVRLFKTIPFASFRHDASGEHIRSILARAFVDENATETLRQFFPNLYEEHRNLATAFSSYHLNPLFGAFASVCINKGIVATVPHRDASNRGPGLCGVVPFGRFDSSRSGLLVLWEARTVIEVASGDVCLFPSAIITHSNTVIHPDDDRNSLAFWTGASLFLLADMKGRSKTDMSLEEEQAYYARASENWVEAWNKFPMV